MKNPNDDRFAKYLKSFDLEAFQKGFYTDKYFINIRDILEGLTQHREQYSALNHPRNTFQYANIPTSSAYEAGEATVEMQWFTRRPGKTVIAAMEMALACLRYCTGYWQEGTFIDTSEKLSVWAVDEGSIVEYGGRPDQVSPVIKVRGRYRDFGVTETLTIGYLSRASRVATNMYEVFEAANGKNVLFFPARYDLPDVQPIDGLAYATAIETYNRIHGASLSPLISTDAQGIYIGAKGGGTIPHAAIASFLGDTVQTTLAFAEIVSPEVSRVALVDFENDSVRTSIAVAKEMFAKYYQAMKSGDSQGMKKYKLFGVRLDTSAALRDVSVPETGDRKRDNGVNPRLVHFVRKGLDEAWQGWGNDVEKLRIAKDFCNDIKIIVSGGFNKEKIQQFEKKNVPVDLYAVGSAAFDNHGSTNTDFTADVVQVKIGDMWTPLAKVGRQANESKLLKKVW